MNSSFFAQRKRKPTTVVIDDEDNQIKDGMNNNAKKKKTKNGNFALMSLQYLLVRLVNPNFHKKEMKKITASLFVVVAVVAVSNTDTLVVEKAFPRKPFKIEQN